MHKPWRAALLIIFLVVTAILLVGYSRNEVQRANDIKVAIRATGGNPHRGPTK